MTQFHVDLEALEALAMRLTTLNTQWQDVDQKDDFSKENVGDGGLLEELRDFTTGWRDGRAKIKNNCVEGAARLEDAIDGYREVETCLVEGMGGSDGG